MAYAFSLLLLLLFLMTPPYSSWPWDSVLPRLIQDPSIPVTLLGRGQGQCP